jgi:hypothetical protein
MLQGRGCKRTINMHDRCASSSLLATFLLALRRRQFVSRGTLRAPRLPGRPRRPRPRLPGLPVARTTCTQINTEYSKQSATVLHNSASASKRRLERQGACHRASETDIYAIAHAWYC